MALLTQNEFGLPGVQVPKEDESGAARKEGARGRLIQLDFVRGIAILMVMAHHFLSWPTQSTLLNALSYPGKRVGWAGVDLFFVLSGFLVGGLLIGELYRTGNLRILRFIKRRGFKIWPAYYFYLLFELVSRHVPAHTFLLPNLLHLQNYLGTSLEHTWTLAVEEHFYLLLPFLLVWIYRSPARAPHAWKIFLGICGLILLIRSVQVLAFHSTHVQLYTHTRLDSLLFGVLLSHFYYFHREAFDRFSRRRGLLAAMTLAGIVFLFLVPGTSPLMQTIGYTFGYLCFAALMLLVLSIKGRTIHSWPFRACAWVGVYSYSIYLWHNSVRTPLYHLCAHLPGGDAVRWFALYAAEFACAIVLGALTSKMIEWPFLRLRERVVPV